MHRFRFLAQALILGVLSLHALTARAEPLQQIVSREHPDFQARSAVMTLGRDGRVYLASGGNDSYVLRLNLDGSQKAGFHSGPALVMVTANQAGIMGVARAHFTHSVFVHDPQFQQLGVCNDFLVGDHVGFDAPMAVLAGDEEFFGIDQHRTRILQLDGQGKILNSFPVRAADEPAWHFGAPRYNDKTQCFYWRTIVPTETWQRWIHGQEIRRVDRSGKTRELLAASGPFDVAADGTVIAFDRPSNSLFVFQPRGDEPLGAPRKPDQQIKVEGDPETLRYIDTLWIAGDEILLRRPHETELFVAYDRQSGAPRRVVSTNHERLLVDVPNPVWTSGADNALSLTLEAGQTRLSGVFRIEAAALGSDRWHSLGWDGANARWPEHLPTGVWQLRVQGPLPEYRVRTLVEVRRPGSQGTISTWTEGRRCQYAQSQDVPLQVVLRSEDLYSVDAQLRLDDESGENWWSLPLKLTRNEVVRQSIPTATLGQLAPGRYWLRTVADHCTDAAQLIEIGPGRVQDDGLLHLMFGDYNPTFPYRDLDVWTGIEPVGAAHVRRLQRLGFNLMTDRLGIALPTGLSMLDWEKHIGAAPKSPLGVLRVRLEKDLNAVAPDAVLPSSPLNQVLAGYSAYGMYQMAILTMMDAGLPLGTGFDPRTREQFADAINRVTGALKAFPAFRGWCWTANFWEYHPDKRFANDAEKQAYQAARKQYVETGKWDPLLGQMDERLYQWSDEAHSFFNNALQAAGGSHLVSSNSGPYRRPHAHPPRYFQQLNEVDLQYQAEQLGHPNWTSQAPDYYHRPGKRTLIHPELMNELGTGQQALPMNWLALMRGVDGLGVSGQVPHWTRFVDDPRHAQPNIPSIYRTLFGQLELLGPWLRSLQNDDEVAILVCPRSAMLDDWAGASHMGIYFTRLFVAHQACLYAHRPATYIFPEEVRSADELRRFKALLVIDQRVEMDDHMRSLIQGARAAGTLVLADRSCRDELVADLPRVELDCRLLDDIKSVNNDYAWWEYGDRLQEAGKTMAAALAPRVQPVAGCDQSQVMLSRRQSGSLRAIFAVNNTRSRLTPGELWRVNLGITTLEPTVAQLTLPSEGAVYDVLARQRVQPSVTADLRYEAGRIYAVLPQAIERVEVASAATVEPGATLTVQVKVLDGARRPIDATLPVVLRLRDEAGQTTQRRSLAVPAQGLSVQLPIARQLAGQALTIEAVDLLAGQSTAHLVQVNGSSAVVAAEPALPDPTWADLPHHGPRVRDIALSADGKTLVCSTFNWDQNFYGVDTSDGSTRWHQKVADYYTFAPQRWGKRFVVQGYDLASGAGYHLYDVDHSGAARRRFELPGIPQRLNFWFVGGLLRDRINQFAAPAHGGWVAAAGNLGLACWDDSGKLRFQRDWSDEQRQTPLLAALGKHRLLVAQNGVLECLDADNGMPEWRKELAPGGSIQRINASADGKTLGVQIAIESGSHVLVLRNAELLTAVQIEADEYALSADGERLVVLAGKQVTCYRADGSALWTYQHEQPLYRLRLRDDGQRTALSSDVGDVIVLNGSGALHWKQDAGALAVGVWMPNGDLLTANWNGVLQRYDDQGQRRYRTYLNTGSPDASAMAHAKPIVPTSRFTSWQNQQEIPAWPSDNLLTQTRSHFSASYIGDRIQLAKLEHKVETLWDGNLTAPDKPWLDWHSIAIIESGWYGPLALQIDTFAREMRIDAISFAEDPNHPESWLRDVKLEYWDADQNKWVFAQYLKSDAAVHQHRLAQPIQTSRIRLVQSDGYGWPVGNVRLAEIALHGQLLGGSHPDVRHRKPVAVLFDEGEPIFNTAYIHAPNEGLELRVAGSAQAYSGAHDLHLSKPRIYGALWNPPAGGHAVPNWDFEIAENPQPGQYRYLQFAVKAMSPQTSGAGVQLGNTIFAAGNPAGPSHVPVYSAHDKLGQTWQLCTVDLWEAFKGNPPRIQALQLICGGGPAAIDRIILARTRSDLPPPKANAQ